MTAHQNYPRVVTWMGFYARPSPAANPKLVAVFLIGCDSLRRVRRARLRHPCLPVHRAQRIALNWPNRQVPRPGPAAQTRAVGRGSGPLSSERRRALEAAWDRIDRAFDDHLDAIREYLRQPSVSATGEGIDGGAAATAALIEAAGGSAEIVPTPGHPAVIGQIPGQGPTLLRYGMYDVQPVDEPNWGSPPFGAAIRDLPHIGRSVVARGAANSKGCLAAFLLAIKSARAVGALPVTTIMIVDGEEELGSPNLPAVLAERRSDLEADAAFDLDLSGDATGTSDVFLGCKGILSLHLSCKGGKWGGPSERAVHSSVGVAIASPAWSLVRALSALVTDDEEPRVSGLAPPRASQEDEKLLRVLAENFDPNVHLQEYGAARYKNGKNPHDVVHALVYEPAVNLNGVHTGTLFEDKTIIPDEARAVIDVRFSYGVDADAATASIKEAVAEVAPEVEVEAVEVCPPAKTSSRSPVARALVESHTDAGVRTRVWPSAPWWAPYYLLEQNLGLPFAIGGAGRAGRAHSADEYATVQGLREHMRQSIAFLHRFASEHEAGDVE
jgi:acetylornithine deacetylase/succinyl-diaminopimelate desuccinylase-like protein